jgi:TolB-like protein/Tfp pilus assembly protein PilF
MDPTRFVRELRRRGVFRGAAFYVVAAWVTLQVSDLALPGLGLPESAIRFVWIGAFLGFPLALFFSWRYEFTRDGIVRTPPSSGEAVDARLHALDYALLAALLAIAGAIAYGVVGQVRRTNMSPHASLVPLPEGRISIVVLPLRNASGDPEQEYLSDGLTEELIVQLGRLHPDRLGVIARTSAMRYKNTEKSVADIGRELDVGYVLEGSALREGNRVRITAELIQASDQTQLWAESYDRELSGILELQRDVARAVAKSLAVKLLPREQARLAAVGSVNAEAYDAYLKGSQYWIRLGAADLDAAEKYFNLALEKDPRFAPAYVGLAWVWICRQQVGYVRPGEAGPRAKAAVSKALDLDDAFFEAHLALADILTWTDWNWAAAGREWERAIELNPGYPDTRAYYSHYLLITGRPEEGLKEIETAIRMDPFNVIFLGFYAVVLEYFERHDDALEVAGKALEIMPDNVPGLQVQWWAYEGKRMHEKAFASATAYYRAIYGDLEKGGVLDRTYSANGYAAAMGRAAELLVERSRIRFVLPTDIAYLYLSAGDREQALAWLERGYEVHDPNMPYLGWPDYDPLRSDPRFQDLVRRMNLPE